MTLDDVRRELDEIDSQLIELFDRRLDLAPEVAKAKLSMNKPVFDPERERRKLASITARARDDRAPQLISLFSLLMSMNKIEQNRYLAGLDESGMTRKALDSLLPATAHFPLSATVACQGVEGAYSQIAASRLFKVSPIYH